MEDTGRSDTPAGEVPAVLNRWIGILSGLAMLVANGALFWQHVLPGWLASPPPPTDVQTLRSGERRATQVAIWSAGQRVGRSWTVAQKVDKSVDIRTITLIEKLPLPQDLRQVTPLPVAIETRINYLQPEYPDSLEIILRGLGLPVSVKGQYFSGDFACEWQFGDQRGSFLVDPGALRALGDVVRPFDRLPGLAVGMSWEVKLFNPLSQALPGMRSSLAPDSVYVHVTGLETIKHPRTGGDIETFVVEVRQPSARAWVAPDGRVLRQEVDVPILGRLTILEEEYDDDLFRETAMRHWPE